MSTLREAAQQALDALYDIDATGVPVGHIDLVIDTLRAALAQQEQTCNCRWVGDVQTQQCTLHEAHVDAIHEWAERAKTAEAALAQEEATCKAALQVEPEGGRQSAPSPQVTQRIADMPMSEYRRGVNDGFKLGLREGRIKAEDEMREQQREQEQPVRDMLEEAAELRRLHAVNQELLEALKECLPYVGQTLANTGSMDAYYTEAKVCAAINAAERNT